jgi:TetR/AcrR family transcriptional regulator, fatty acid metabolism regulator protein
MSEGVAGHSLKERQYQEREEFILQVAEDLLLARGYHDVSMDDIATQVGIARGTLYRHFASKEDLAFVLIKRDISALANNIEEILAMDTNAQERLEAALHATYRTFAGKFMLLPDKGAVMSILSEKIVEIQEAREELLERIRRLIEAGQASGEFDVTLPADALSLAFFSFASPIFYMRMVTQGNKTEEELMTCLTRMYLKVVAIPGNHAN